MDLADPEHPFKATFQQHLKFVVAFDGTQAAYDGQLIEKPNTVIVVVNWETLECYIKALKSPYVTPLI